MRRLAPHPVRLGAAGIALMLLATPALAQVDEAPLAVGPGLVDTGMTFLVSLIAGVVLAIAIQVLLTNLAIALGLNIIGPFHHDKDDDEHKQTHKHGHKHSVQTNPGGNPHGNPGNPGGNPGNPGGNPGNPSATAHAPSHGGKNLFRSWRKANRAIGTYAIITAAVGLFFATWLGVGLSYVGTGAPFDPGVGVVLGLVIWGVTMLIMARFEWSAMTSLAGGLYHMAGSGLRNVVGMAKSAFTTSTADKAIEHGAERVEEMAREITEEMLGSKPGKTLDRKLHDYMRMIRPERKSPERMRRELESMLDDLELHVVAQDQRSLGDSEEIVAQLVHKGHAPSRARRLAKQAMNTLETIAAERGKEGKATPAKAIDAAQRISGKTEEEATRDRERIETFLRNTHRDELNPEAVERELLDIFRHPKQGADEVYHRIRSINRDTIVAMLEQRKDISHEDAERIVTKAENVIEGIRSRVSSAVGTVTGTAREVSETAESGMAHAEESLKERRDTLVAKLRDYLDRTGREELDLDEMLHDLKLLFTHPSEGVSHWRDRLKHLDRDTIKGVIAARKDLDEHDAEMIINQIETARDAALTKLHEVEETVSQRLRAAREYALEQADEARKTAANMAWWALGTGVVSGAAAAVGGLLGAGFFV